MSYTRLTLNTPNLTEDQLVSLMNWQDGMGPHEGMQGLMNILKGITGGQHAGSITATTGATFATATITVSAGGSANDETAIICGVTITAKTSGADTTAGEFNISATQETQAANMLTMFQNTDDFSGIITASRNGAVVTLTAAAPGAIGNGLQATDVDLANVAISSFATVDTGSDGTSYEIDLV